MLLVSIAPLYSPSCLRYRICSMVTKIKNNIASRARAQEQLMKKLGLKHRRNDALFDIWSLTHLAWAAILAWVMNPVIALSIMVLWEPIEVLILSPWFASKGIEFGYESLRNSLSDIAFDVLGVLLGMYLLAHYFEPPFYLFGG